MNHYDPTDLRGQELSAAEKSAKERLLREVEEGDVKWLMSSKRGRRIVWRLLEQAGVFRLSFSTNAMQMSFNEGNRNFGNRTLAQIHALCPELYATLVKENVNVGNDARNGDQSN